MNRFLVITSIVFAVLGIVLSILPLGTIALIPTVLALVTGFISIFKQRNHKLSKIVFFIVFLNLLFVVGREVLVKDTVVADEQFEQVKQQSEQESKQELEELESLPQ